jgi:hypothetical protein
MSKALYKSLMGGGGGAFSLSFPPFSFFIDFFLTALPLCMRTQKYHKNISSNEISKNLKKR